MDSQPYDEEAKKAMILRDHLAAARTVLANERTILAYLRTALATVAAGVAVIRFAVAPSTKLIGWLLLPIGAVCLIVGISRYFYFKRYISSLTTPEESGDR